MNVVSTSNNISWRQALTSDLMCNSSKLLRKDASTRLKVDAEVDVDVDALVASTDAGCDAGGAWETVMV